jgi:hypothetical protein
MATASDVLKGDALWSVEQADAIEWLRSLPDDSIDLLVTSPPYLEARTYGAEDISRGIDEWVPWMVEVIRAAAPKVKGLIAVNCEGQTRNYAYQPAPFLLVADLFRAGFNLRKPPVFHRVGIPGSGGPDWLRNDYEPIICVTREGRLPWSDNTACGHPPKYGPGGAISHRTIDGTRVNAQTTTRRNRGKVEPQVAEAIAGELELPPGSRLCRMSEKDGTMRTKLYRPPEKANPGNILEFLTGGGHMGSACASHNEAPFPLELPTFFIRSFCPPGGVVADCFGGSGTVIDAAVQCGRRGISCDVRASQVELAQRRMRNCTPALFTEEA